MFNKEFKTAISHLPSEKKDKLILRLLKKDLDLANRLHSELVDSHSKEEFREQMELKIKSDVKRALSYEHNPPGYLMMDLRDLSGSISYHVKLTKDKYGEASLNLLMLTELLPAAIPNIEKYTPGKTRKLCIYIIARTFKIMILIKKLHEDLFIEFRDQLEQLGEALTESKYLMKTAILNGLDVQWLLSGEIPDDISEIHKDIRAKGFLK